MRLALSVAAAVAVSTTASAGEPQDPPMADAYIGPGQKVQVAPGRTLNMVCMGSGEHMVLFDAGGSDWSVIWALVQPGVARHARACAYDRAGLGHSDLAPGARTPIAIVEDLHALIQAASPKRPVILVGHSLGGFNVKLYAALHPQDVAALVLVDPSEERDWERSRDWITRKYGRRLAARSELLDKSFLAWLMARYRQCGEAVASGSLDPSSTMYRRCSDPVRPRLGPSIAAERRRLQVLPAYQAAQSSEVLNSLYGDRSGEPVYERLFRKGAFGRKPMIVLTHGTYDAADPLESLGQAQMTALHGESARLSRIGVRRTVPDSGHNIPIDAPGAVEAAVLEVLKQLH